MNPEGVERIVIADLGLDDGDGDVADDTADGADEKGRKGCDEACCRGNGD